MEESIFTDRLPNGVAVLTEEMPSVRSATLGIWVSVGSMHEPQEMAGVCHFLEHMAFKGTATRSARQIAEALDTVGGQLNAFTDKELTCFFAQVLAEDVPLALEILCDMLRNSLFREPDVRCEKRVILEEIRQLEDEPDELIHDLLLEEVWQGHPLGRPVIGRRGSVRSLNREKLLQFRADAYTADRITVAVAGNVQRDAVLAQAAALLGDMQPAAAPQAMTAPVLRQSRRRINRRTEQTHLCLGMPGVSQHDSDRYTLAVLDTILGAASSSRLFQEIREKRGLVYTIGSCPLSYRDAGVLTVYACTSPGSTDKVLEGIRKEYDRILNEGVQEREVAQARSQLKGSMLLSLEGTSNRMARIAKSFLYYGRIHPIAEIEQQLDAVTAADVDRLARATLLPECTSVITMGPSLRRPARRQTKTA